MHFSLSSQTFSSFYSFVNSTLKLFSSFFCNGCWQLLFILCTITSESLWHLTLLTLTVGCCLSYQDCWDFVLLNMSSKEESCLAQISIVQLTTWGFSNIKTFWGKKITDSQPVLVSCHSYAIERSMSPPSHFTLNSHFHSNASSSKLQWLNFTTKNRYKLVWYRIIGTSWM